MTAPGPSDSTTRRMKTSSWAPQTERRAWSGMLAAERQDGETAIPPLSAVSIDEQRPLTMAAITTTPDDEILTSP